MSSPSIGVVPIWFHMVKWFDALFHRDVLHWMVACVDMDCMILHYADSCVFDLYVFEIEFYIMMTL